MRARPAVADDGVVLPVLLAGAAVTDPDLVDVDLPDGAAVLREAGGEDTEEVDADGRAVERVAVVPDLADDERFAALDDDVVGDDG